MVHFFSFFLSVVALGLLVVFACLNGDAIDIVTYSVFGAILASFYFVRFYLGLDSVVDKSKLARLDHVLIYLLTAATYTTVALRLPNAAWGWSIFGVAVGLTLLAGAFRLWSRFKASWITVGFYSALLILDLVAFDVVHDFLSFKVTFWFSVGALFYLFETYLVVYRPSFSLIKRFKTHENLAAPFAIIGSTCHFSALIILLT